MHLDSISVVYQFLNHIMILRSRIGAYLPNHAIVSPMSPMRKPKPIDPFVDLIKPAKPEPLKLDNLAKLKHRNI